MKQFGSVLKAEANRFANRRKLFTFMIILLISTYFVITDGQKYKLKMANIDEFQKIEASMAKDYRSYSHLSKSGLRILYVPSTLSIFFSSSSSNTELTARINSVAILDINENRKNSQSSSKDFPFQLSLSIVLIILFSVIFSYEGFSVPREKSYLSMISSLSKRLPQSLIVPILLIRFTFILAALVFITGCMVGLVLLLGFNLTMQDITSLAGFVFIESIGFLVFMFAGSLVGRIHRIRTSYGVLAVVWLSLICVLPVMTNMVNDVLSIEVTSTHKVCNQKLSNINDFENGVLKKHGKFDRKKITLFRQLVQWFVDNIYKDNEAMESGIREQMAKNAGTYDSIAIFNPVSFYFRTSSAAGSCSDNNLIEFYKYAQAMKRKFLEFIIQRTYYNDPKVMVPFIKGDENLFYAQSHLPPNFWTGVFLNLFIVLVLGVVTFFVYRRDDTNAKFVIVPRVPPGEMNSNISYNRYSALYVKNDRLRDFLFKLFSGVIPGSLKAADWSLKIDDVDVFSEEFQGDFFYICRPGDIPGDIKVKNFLSFFASLGGVPSEQKESILAATELQKLMNKRFHQLEDAESFEVMFSLTRLVKRKVYLVDDILGDLGHTYALRMLKRMMEIGKKGDIILYLTHRLRAPEKMEEFNGDVDFCRGDTWLYDLKSRGLVLED